MKKTIKNIIRFLYNLFLACDQALNSLLLGHPDETLSSRLGRTINREKYFFVKPLRIAIDTIFFFDTKIITFENGNEIKIFHCQKSVMPLEQQNFRELIDYEIWSWNK